LSEGGTLVALIKPQFEAGREDVGKKGVVRDASVHRSVIEGISEFAHDTGFSLLGLDFSPIKGPEGNIEYLLYLAKDGRNAPFSVDTDIAEIVLKSHEM
jgi:23S rRNA (cytidine1920-2'-O)/16S rRNA (cytidine1409-2'-O)-methyltransferase